MRDAHRLVPSTVVAAVAAVIAAAPSVQGQGQPENGMRPDEPRLYTTAGAPVGPPPAPAPGALSAHSDPPSARLSIAGAPALFASGVKHLVLIDGLGVFVLVRDTILAIQARLDKDDEEPLDGGTADGGGANPPSQTPAGGVTVEGEKGP